MANTGYVPILIVAQDENDEYIHIKDAKENTNYFCPCCHQPVKMRAKSSKKVQPHFYHITESPCVNSETLIHWTCQMTTSIFRAMATFTFITFYDKRR